MTKSKHTEVTKVILCFTHMAGGIPWSYYVLFELFERIHQRLVLDGRELPLEEFQQPAQTTSIKASKRFNQRDPHPEGTHEKTKEHAPLPMM